MATYDVGDAVLIDLTVRDPLTGQLANASTVALTVTAPDGATSTPSPTNASTGYYLATVDTDAAGLWRYEWTTTGPAGSQHGSFAVRADPPSKDWPEPFASIEDLVNRVGALSEEAAARAPALLGDATAEIRDFIGQHVSRVTDDVVVLAPIGTKIHLPERPVIDVTAVALVDGDTDRPLTGWSWDRIATVDLRGAVAVSSSPQQTNGNTYRVTYSHGVDVIPRTLVGKTCRIVNRCLMSPTLAEGLTSENIGAYGYQSAQQTGTAGTGIYLSRADRQDLIDMGRRYGWRVQSGTIPLRAA